VIRQSELRNNNAEVMRRVDAGESFVVTVHGRPVADLVPHQRRASGGGVPLAEFRAAVEALGLPADDDWRRDLDREPLDDVVADPWERG
jgi:prevent-host-death family protein